MVGDIYHLLNRGVEKRKVFFDNIDYIRFVHNLNDFNDKNNVYQPYYVRRQQKNNKTDVGRPYKVVEKKKLVDIICWTLMPNHSHIMTVDKEEGKLVSDFSKKVFGGYTKYFNKKNNRSGVLFQGKTKIILLQNDKHLLYLPFYIHLNPLNIFQQNWKEVGVKDVKKAIEFLEQYRWSNYRDIISTGNNEFSNISNKALFFEMFNTNEKKYKKDLEEWLYSKEYKNN